jgi:hypothetical protein
LDQAGRLSAPHGLGHTDRAVPDDIPAGANSPGLGQYLAPWYLAYLILGVIHSGMLPFLLPLMLAVAGHDLDSIAYVVAAYNAGLVPAPLLGILAERQCWFRPVFFGGFIALSLGLSSTMIEFAWLWQRHQPASTLSRWFHSRVGKERGRIRRISIVALARKLLIAVWRYVTHGEIPEGAVLKAA